MKKQLFLLIITLSGLNSEAQKSLDKLLNQYNKNNVPYVSVQELAMPKTNAILLDAREPNEYEISRIDKAICVGFDNFNLESTLHKIPSKDSEIIVYCSLGIRSEIVADKLIKAGYTNVRNLYGGIFEWKNNNFKVYNSKKTETDSVHAFSEEWSKWLKKGIKIYPKPTEKIAGKND